MSVIVIENQSLLDIAIQEDGTAMAALDWAIANKISVTDELVPGQSLINPNSIYKDNDVLNFFKSKSKRISTGIIITEDNELLRGIGYMSIGLDFKVS